MIQTKIVLHGIAFLFLGLIICSAGCINLASTTYTAGVSPSYAPLSELNSSTQEFSGLDIDILKWIAKDQKIYISFTPCLVSTYQSEMETGTIDLMAAMTITEERKAIVNFTDPYLEGTFRIVAKKNCNITAKDVFAGTARISIQKGSAQEAWVINHFGPEEFAARVADGRIKQRYIVDAVLQDVSGMETDAAILTVNAIAGILPKYPLLQPIGNVGEPKYTAYGVSKEHPELLTKLNAGLKNLMASPDWQEMLQKHSIEVRKQTYIFGVDDSAYPFTYYDETGNLTGYDIEAAKWIAEKQNFTIEFKPVAWPQIIEALNNREIDAIYSYMIVSDTRSKQITFTSPYITSEMVAVVKTDSGHTIDAFNNRELRIGTASGTIESKWLGRYFFDDYYQMLRDGKILYYPNYTALYFAIHAGELDGLVTSRELITDQLLNGTYTILLTQKNGVCAAAVRNGDVYLLPLLNEGIAELISSGKAEELGRKYGVSA